MAGGSVTLRIATTGGEQVRSELASLGPAGESAMRRIAASSQEASGALRALDAGIELAKDNIHELAMESGSFGKVIKEIGPLGLAVAAGLGVAGIAAEKLFEQTKEAGEFVEAIEKTAKVVGVSTDALQEYHHAAGQFGIDNEAADKALQSLNEHIGHMQTGVRDARDKKIFAQLGLTRADFADVQNAADFLPELADRLDKLDSEAKRVSIAKSLGVEELLPMLEAGSGSINKLREDAHSLGIVIGEDLIEKTSAANRQMKQASEIIKADLTTAFAPLMTVLATATTDLGEWLHKLEGWIQRVRDAYVVAKEAAAAADKKPSAPVSQAQGLWRDWNALIVAGVDIAMGRDKGHPQGAGSAPVSKVGEVKGPRAADQVSLGDDDDDRHAAAEAKRKAEEAKRNAEEVARQAQELTQRQDNSTQDALKKADADLLRAKLEGLKYEQGKANAAAEQYAATKAELDKERADRDKELHAVDDQGHAKFRAAEIAQIEAAEEAVRQQKLKNAAAERDKALADARRNQDKALDALNLDLLRSQEGLARTTEERRQLALSLLEMTRADEWKERQAQLRNTPNVTQADIDAQRRLFDQETVLQREAALRANLGPLGNYRQSIEDQSGKGAADHAESEAVEDLGKLDDALTQVELGSTTAGKALAGLGQSIENQLLHDFNQQMIVAPLSKTVEGFIQKVFPAVSDTGATTSLQALAQSALQASEYLASMAAAGGVPGARSLLATLGGVFPSSMTDGVSFDSLQASGQWANFDGITAAGGGLIRGPGTSTSDSIPARLSDGEFVVRAEATRQHLPMLHAMNEGRVAGFAEGGQVGRRFPYVVRNPADQERERENNPSGNLTIHNHTGVPAKAHVAKGSNGDMLVSLVPMGRDFMKGHSADPNGLVRDLRRLPKTMKTRVR